MLQELDAFLATRPDLRFIDVLLHDIHGVDRGKRVDVASARSTFGNGLLLPGSMFALDVPGGTVQVETYMELKAIGHFHQLHNFLDPLLLELVDGFGTDGFGSVEFQVIGIRNWNPHKIKSPVMHPLYM